jgi:hypothetical protein
MLDADGHVIEDADPDRPPGVGGASARHLRGSEDGSPLGWLWTRMTAAADSRIAAQTSRGWTAGAVSGLRIRASRSFPVLGVEHRTQNISLRKAPSRDRSTRASAAAGDTPGYSVLQGRRRPNAAARRPTRFRPALARKLGVVASHALAASASSSRLPGRRRSRHECARSVAPARRVRHRRRLHAALDRSSRGRSFQPIMIRRGTLPTGEGWQRDSPARRGASQEPGGSLESLMALRPLGASNVWFCRRLASLVR